VTAAMVVALILRFFLFLPSSSIAERIDLILVKIILRAARTRVFACRPAVIRGETRIEIPSWMRGLRLNVPSSWVPEWLAGKRE